MESKSNGSQTSLLPNVEMIHKQRYVSCQRLPEEPLEDKAERRAERRRHHLLGGTSNITLLVQCGLIRFMRVSTCQEPT